MIVGQVKTINSYSKSPEMNTMSFLIPPPSQSVMLYVSKHVNKKVVYDEFVYVLKAGNLTGSFSFLS